MAVGKGSMARASKAAGKKKAEIIEEKTMNETIELKVETEQGEDGAETEKKAAEAQPKKPVKTKIRKTTTRKPRAKKTELEAPQEILPEQEKKNISPKVDTYTNISIGDEMPIYYY